MPVDQWANFEKLVSFHGWGSDSGTANIKCDSVLADRPELLEPVEEAVDVGQRHIREVASKGMALDGFFHGCPVKLNFGV